MLGTSQPRSGGKRDLITQIRMARVHTMSLGAACESTKGYMSKSVEELRLIWGAEFKKGQESGLFKKPVKGE